MNATQHVEASRKVAKEPAYVQSSGNSLYTAFVTGKGFRANVSLRSALEFIRESTGKKRGSVPCFDEVTKEWTSEFELDEAVPDCELELNADGIIRDANSGEHFGYVPGSLRSLYAAAPDLLAACESMLKENYMPNSSMDIAVRARKAIANAKGGV